ncbi:MAG: DoxX family protein [Actinomycetota bacterium]
MGVLAWIVGLLLAAGIAMAGVSKLRGDAAMVETQERFGMSAGLFRIIGGLEVLAAIGLIIGLFTDGQNAEWIGFLAAVGLILLLIGAVVSHARAGDPPSGWVPAIVMLALSVLYIIFIGAR